MSAGALALPGADGVIAAITQRIAEADASIEESVQKLRDLRSREQCTRDEQRIAQLQAEMHRVESRLKVARRERTWDAERLDLLRRTKVGDQHMRATFRHQPINPNPSSAEVRH